MPSKKYYESMKAAYQITLNGCGKDCLVCEREDCISDDPEIQALAQKWAKQKECERVFYYSHREQRLQGAKDYYNTHYKRSNPNQPKIVTKDALDQLPKEFTYDDAAKVWGIVKHTAIERVKKLLVRYPGCITKQPRMGSRPIKMWRNV